MTDRAEMLPNLGLRHLALWIEDSKFDSTVRFYTEGVGLRVDWHPDRDNIYLTSGQDNFALHRAVAPREVDMQRAPLDHLGFVVPRVEDLELWHERLSAKAELLKVEILNAPRQHRDGASSFYLLDPAGHKVQILHLPNLSAASYGGPNGPSSS